LRKAIIKGGGPAKEDESHLSMFEGKFQLIRRGDMLLKKGEGDDGLIIFLRGGGHGEIVRKLLNFFNHKWTLIGVSNS